MLCDGLTGGRKRGGKEAQDGGDIWYGRFTLLCASGWHNIVKQLYSNKKNVPRRCQMLPEENTAPTSPVEDVS